MDKEKEKKKTTTSSRQNNTKKNNTSKNQNLNKKKTNNNVKKQNGNQKNNAVSKNVSVPSKKSSNKQSESAKKNMVRNSNPKKANIVQRNANIQGKKTNKVSSSHSDVKKNASRSQAVTNKSPNKKTNSSPKLSNQNVEKKNITQKKTKKVLENKNVKTAIKKEVDTKKPNVSTNLPKENKKKKPLEKVKLKKQETTNQNIITTKSLDIVKNTEKVSKAKKKTVSIIEEPKEEIKKKKKIYKKKVNFDTAQSKNKKDVKEILASKKKEKEKQLKSVAKKHVKEKSHKHKKHVNTKLVWLLFIITFTGAFAFSTINIVNKSIDKTVTLKEQEEIEEMTVMEELPEDETKQEMVNAPKENVISDYWKYVRLPLMKVDFNELLAKNEETVAFLKVNGTNINYPVVQTKDNTFYLDHSYDKTSNDAGWVFMDYRNNIADFDDNTIIYAHGMTSFSSENTTMFGSLRKILKSDWYENTDNYVIYLTTPTISTLWQVFSVYSIPTETYYLTTNFGTKKSYEEFINTLVGRSVFDFNAEVNAEDKILTLSTCYDSETKVVMHAKLIKKQNLGE